MEHGKRTIEESTASLLSEELYDKSKYLLYKLKSLPDFLIIGTKKEEQLLCTTILFLTPGIAANYPISGPFIILY